MASVGLSQFAFDIVIPKMSRKGSLFLVIALGVAEFFTGLVVIRTLYFLLVPGVLFGATLSVCLWFFTGLRSLWKLILLAAASLLAFPISGATCIYLEYFSPWPFHTPGTDFAHISNASLFAGGALGAFLLLVALFRVVGSEQPMTKVLFRALCWSLLGGGLGVAGHGLGPWVGTALWPLEPNFSPNDTLETAVLQGRTGIDSLLLVWQTGMGFVLGIALTASTSLDVHVTKGELSTPD